MPLRRIGLKIPLSWDPTLGHRVTAFRRNIKRIKHFEPRRWGQYVVPKRRDIITQRHGVIYQRNGIL